MKKFIAIILVWLCSDAQGQNFLQSSFPKRIVTTQFAGSTGFLSVGYGRASRNDKIEVGLMYGMVPAFGGRAHHAIVLKGTYNPFRLNLPGKFIWEPLQTGLFISQNFGRNLALTWGKEYPFRYYWWTRSVRFHGFVASQISYKIDTQHLDRLSAYFEVNTNDLYLMSYLPNRQTLKFYDILFFGAGLKLYIK